jgi:aryl-alcohol dehydrogenase-like predicted oxidoreductase
LVGAIVETRSIGPLAVSVVGLGCNNFGKRVDEQTAQSIVDAAIDSGINFFDTADRYGAGDQPFSGVGQSEVFLGQAVENRRDQVILATKFGNPMSETDQSMRGAGRSWVSKACDASLKRLGTDYIDLYQLHRPDPGVPIAETLGALHDLVEQGKVRVVGCSNFTVAQLAEAEKVASQGRTARFESVQNEYSMLVRDPEKDILPLCSDLGIAFLPYFPLASGLLTGKYRKGEAAPSGSRLETWTPREHFREGGEDLLDRVEVFRDFAESAGHSLLELAFAWLLSRPQVASVIAGATRADQVRSNAASSEWQIDPNDLQRLER